MEEIEQTAISTYHVPPWFWKKYVDNSCTVLPKGSVEEFHQHLNTINKHIQFMVEKAANYPSLPGHLLYMISGWISANSCLSEENTSIPWLLFTPSSLTQSLQQQHYSDELGTSRLLLSTGWRRLVISVLKKNGYPKQFIQRSAPPPSQPEHQTDNGADSNTEVENTRKPSSVTLPYVQGLSETIKRLLEKLDVRVRLRPNWTHHQAKGPRTTWRMDRSGIQDSLQRLQENIFRTVRSLASRIEEHEWAVRGDTNTSTNSCFVPSHMRIVCMRFKNDMHFHDVLSITVTLFSCIATSKILCGQLNVRCTTCWHFD